MDISGCISLFGNGIFVSAMFTVHFVYEVRVVQIDIVILIVADGEVDCLLRVFAFLLDGVAFLTRIYSPHA